MPQSQLFVLLIKTVVLMSSMIFKDRYTTKFKHLGTAEAEALVPCRSSHLPHVMLTEKKCNKRVESVTSTKVSLNSLHSQPAHTEITNTSKFHLVNEICSLDSVSNKGSRKTIVLLGERLFHILLQ